MNQINFEKITLQKGIISFRAPLITASWIESRIKVNQTRREE